MVIKIKFCKLPLNVNSTNCTIIKILTIDHFSTKRLLNYYCKQLKYVYIIPNSKLVF